jgi:predicted nucleic acid-binding protein
VDTVALDTSFLIDLQREHAHPRRPRGAVAYLRAHPTTSLVVPSVALGEYLEGFDVPDGPLAQTLVRSLEILPVHAGVALRYARVCRALRASGTLIGANDLWVGVTALAAGLPLLTNNAEHFGRIPGLIVIGYATYKLT